MGVVYTAQFQAVAVSVAQDLFEILAPTARAIRLLEAKITQHSDTDSEQLRFAVKRTTGAPTSGSGGSTPTPVSSVPGITYSGTVEANNTTRITGGTTTVLEEHSENILNGWHYLPDDIAVHEFEGATRCIVGLEAAPADPLTVDGYVRFEVVGGI